MRRALVLTDEAARHPFRRGLPQHVRTSALAPDKRWWLSWRDGRDFLAAYCACFAATLLFVS